MKPITLLLKMSEIIFDVQNKSYLTGRSLRDTSTPSHVANMQANSDDENEAQVLRSVTMAVSRLRNALAEYLESSDDTTTNGPLESDENLSLTLNMPSNFNNAVTKVIGQAAHDFVVSTALADWFAITAKGETIDYNQAAVTALQVIEEALNKRIRPSR